MALQTPEKIKKVGEDLEDDDEGCGVKDLEELSMTCVYVPCLCLLGQIEEKLREQKNCEDECPGGGEGVREPGELPIGRTARDPAPLQDEEQVGTAAEE